MTEVVRSSATKPLPGSKWMLGAAGILVLAGITAMIAIGYRPDRDPDAEVTAAQTTSGEEVVDASESEDNLSERDRAIAEKFGNRFAASFQSSGDRPEAVTVTSGVGTRDPADYPVVHPRRWPLVGFNLATYAFRGRLIIKTIQPIFRDPASGATETSQMFGRLHPRCEFHQVLAEPGDCVTGIEGVGGTRLHALRVIFGSATPGSASTASQSTADEDNLSGTQPGLSARQISAARRAVVPRSGSSVLRKPISIKSV